jgi:PAS domain S-box-containing protein
MQETETNRAIELPPGLALLMEMLELAPASIGLLEGPELRWAYANRAMVAFCGCESAFELLGKPVRASLPEVEGQSYFETLEEVYRTGTPFSATEQSLVIAKGPAPAVRFVNCVCQPILGVDQKPNFILVHAVDVTEAVVLRRALEESEVRFRLVQTLRDSGGNGLAANTENAEARIRKELERNEAQAREVMRATERLAAIVESSDDAIISKDTDGVVTSWNTGAAKLFGYTADEIIGRSILTVIPPELHSEEPHILQNLRNGVKIDHYETERVRKDGSRVRVSLTISPVRDADGRVIGASKIARDITERDRLQDAIIQSEKLAATGRMAAAIAHEINNPLEAVTNLAYLLNMDSTLSKSSRKYAVMLLDEISRVSNVAKQSLGFFRDTGKPAEFDICRLLDNILDLSKPMLERKHIRVTTDFPASCTVFGLAPEIRQVFANLARNAIEAVNPLGKIRLRVHKGPSGMQHILIADNGAGVSSDILDRLFQPFITSKGSTGNGLGLWVSRGIVNRHGGRILVRTSRRPGKSGTVFLVLLPADEGSFQLRRLPMAS